ncbi:hypothetical protein ACFP3U_04600 [Kitasatospora misakiensis]|uniref:Uncharacterized protein n=1 Tax=Kitasatospora misakiensis TaxID=67330 RepID=A0ABW0WZH3_9ACTN
MDESQSEQQNAPNRSKGAPARLPDAAARAARAALVVRSARESREWPGWALVAVGAVLCVLGWYGVSGERFVEEQVPYLASATVPGAALIVAGVVLVALRSSVRARAEPSPEAAPSATDRRIEHLYALLVDSDVLPDDRPDPAASAAAPLAVPGGTLYHRPDCPLVAGKPTAAPVDARTVRDRALTPCRLCDPEPLRDSHDGPDDPATRPDDPNPPTG